ncbi:MAG TPA: hypothetical protein VL283_00305, partial [Candidatus Baltobacteraceae bacterium]|nr:hypothetical protein [Candidatus Baltobacteraceae bacterium]
MSKRALILGGVGLVGIAGAVFFLLEPDPQAVLHKAQRKLVVEDAMRLDVEGRLVLPQEDLTGIVTASATAVDVVMRTDLDFTVPLKPASLTTFAFSQGAGAAAVKLSGETRRKDGHHYLKLEETGTLSDDIASKVKGKWVSSDRSFFEFVMPPDERSLDEHPLDLAGVTAMGVAIADVQMFRVTKTLPEVKIGDAMARHYAVELNMSAVSALLLKLRELRTGAPVDSEDVLAVTADVVRWGQPLGEVWVGKRDGKFLKIELVSALEGDGANGAVGGMVTFSRWGQRPDIEAPEAEDVEKALGPLFSKRLSLAGDRGTETSETAPVATAMPTAPGAAAQEADSDGDGLADGQEFFYGSDAW